MTGKTKKELIEELSQVKSMLSELKSDYARQVKFGKQAESLLKEKDNFLGLLIEAIPEALAVTDFYGNLLFASPGVSGMFGVPDGEELTGQSVFQFFNDRDHGEIRESLKRRMSGEVVGRKEYTGIRKDGTQFLIEVNGNVIRGGNDGTGQLVYIIRDVSERKILADKLCNKERTLKFFVKHAPAAIAMFDTDMRYLAASNRYIEDYGLAGRTLTGMSHYDIFPGISQEWKEIHQKCLKGEIKMRDEDVFYDENGTTEWIRWEIYPWYEKPGEIGGLFLFTEMITERKQVYEALRTSEHRYHSALDNMLEGCQIIGFDWRYIYVNKAAAKQGKLIKEDLINHSMPEIYPGIEDTPLFRKLSASMHDRTIQKFENEFIYPDGTRAWFDLKVQPVPEGIFILTIDITERKRAENELINHRKLFETMFNAMTDGIIITDVKLNIILANQGMKSTFGYSPEELTGRKPAVLYADRETFLEVGRAAAHKGPADPNEVFTADYKDKNGRIFTCETFGSKLYDNQNNWIGNLAIMRDVTERLKDRDALQKSEERYKYLFENNPIPMWIYDTESLTFLMVNNAALDKYGYTLEEFFRMTIKDIRPKEDIDALLDNIRLAFPALHRSGGWRHRKKNGELFHVEIISHAVEFEGRKARLVLSNDITERELAVSALKESEANYRNLFENHSAVKLIIDIPDGNIISANPAASKFYGWTVDRLKGMKVSQISKQTKKEIKQRIAHGFSLKRNHFESEHALADGTSRFVEIFTSKIRFQGKDCLHSIIHDVTEKKKAEKMLTLLSKTVEQSPVSVIITDPGGKIEYINPMFSHIAGYQYHEAIGKTPGILKSGYHPSGFYQGLWETVKAGENWIGEFRNKRKNGELYWARAIISPIKDSNGEITNYLGIEEDVTEMKQMIVELVEAKENAERAEQLKSSFLANMSHEIRTPLNAILGFTEILVSEEASLNGQYEKMELIRIVGRSADSLLQIINDVLDASRLETGEVKIRKRTFALGPMLNSLYIQFHKKLADEDKEPIKLGLLQAPETLTVNTDENRLSQVFSNLLGNAVKFTKKGQIHFGISSVAPGKIEFIVSDTGIGIPEKDKLAVFERFRQVESTTTRLYGGNGLGLTIAKDLLKLMGGNILLESEEGKGTTFRFWIPAEVS